MNQMTRKTRICFLLILLFSAAVRSQEVFPLPAELQRDVDFWIDIFSHYTTAQGVLHDSRNLAVVYESIDAPANLDTTRSEAEFCSLYKMRN